MRTLIGAAALSLASCTVSSPVPDPVHGRQIAQIEGCISCHGDRLDGHLVEEDAQFAIAWSSNLSRLIPRWDDAAVERTLRSGRRPDGSALWFMPTYVHARLSQTDMRDLIAWMRTVPATGVDHPPLKRGPQFAVALEHEMQDSATQAARLAPRAPAAAGADHARGRYLAQIACSECHGPDLHGARDPEPGQPPDLAAAAAYDPEAFRTLLRTGRGLGGRDLGEMTQYGPERFVGLTDVEIDEIHHYLVARSHIPRR
ncbi:c-type cytochrome [Sphingomonas aliaeris]|uniref:C-type cytochrome n=1 Tax=Sphingomonas aliaeris TaxID=2759526 RepID=A0A974S5F1_9SPHN|nr:c-type cytochrome [Sphingomonas aliaeris]QQV78025.1 c-type cytochrome [Sphingomonas aliaeris]